MGMKSIKEGITRWIGSTLGLGSVAVELTADEITEILLALSGRGGGGEAPDGLRRKLLGCLELLGGDTRGLGS